MRMLFICELRVSEGRPKPERDHAIIEANSRDRAFEKALEAWPDIDAVFSYEVPRKQLAKIPTDLIGKRISKSVAEELMTDCGIAEGDWWACIPRSLVQQDHRWQRLVSEAGVDPDLLDLKGGGIAEVDHLSYAARAILAKFPGPVTLRPSKQKYAGIFLLGLVLAAGLGALSLLDPVGGADLSLYFAVGFLLFCSAVCMVFPVIALVTIRMTLDAAGLEMRSVRVAQRRHWKDVKGFTTATVGIRIVVYEDSTRRGFWGEADRLFLGGPNATLPDTFGFKADELAGLMNAWRERALSQNQ
jgi:hypothetical protein